MRFQEGLLKILVELVSLGKIYYSYVCITEE